MGYLTFEDVSKKYEKSEIYSVDKFNLVVKKGEFIVFVGPSGCGKSTTLRMLAGLEEVTEGTINLEGNEINDVHPKDRDIAMVFQNYALYPHMSVYENICFGLRSRKVDKAEIDEKVQWAAGILGLEEYLKRKPKDLSGGQRQRVALGRAIVRNPKVFLMDEPLSNLDAKLRVVMRNEITSLHKKLGATTVYVTHDQVEAMTMADRIVVMKDGIVQQIGSPMDLYRYPANVFVATFIGAPQMNILKVNMKGNQVIINENCSLTVPSGITKNKDIPEEFLLGFRPEHCSVDALQIEEFPQEVVEIKINNIEHMGNEDVIYTSISNVGIIIKIKCRDNLKAGDSLKVRIDMNKINLFDLSEQRI